VIDEEAAGDEAAGDLIEVALVDGGHGEFLSSGAAASRAPAKRAPIFATFEPRSSSEARPLVGDGAEKTPT
jgi:hypothetical protein